MRPGPAKLDQSCQSGTVPKCGTGVLPSTSLVCAGGWNARDATRSTWATSWRWPKRSKSTHCAARCALRDDQTTTHRTRAPQRRFVHRNRGGTARWTAHRLGRVVDRRRARGASPLSLWPAGVPRILFNSMVAVRVPNCAEQHQDRAARHTGEWSIGGDPPATLTFRGGAVCGRSAAARSRDVDHQDRIARLCLAELGRRRGLALQALHPIAEHAHEVIVRAQQHQPNARRPQPALFVGPDSDLWGVVDRFGPSASRYRGNDLSMSRTDQRRATQVDGDPSRLRARALHLDVSEREHRQRRRQQHGRQRGGHYQTAYTRSTHAHATTFTFHIPRSRRPYPPRYQPGRGRSRIWTSIGGRLRERLRAGKGGPAAYLFVRKALHRAAAGIRRGRLRRDLLATTRRSRSSRCRWRWRSRVASRATPTGAWSARCIAGFDLPRSVAAASGSAAGPPAFVVVVCSVIIALRLRRSGRDRDGRRCW